jgi:hypothetical protein
VGSPHLTERRDGHRLQHHEHPWQCPLYEFVVSAKGHRFRSAGLNRRIDGRQYLYLLRGGQRPGWDGTVRVQHLHDASSRFEPQRGSCGRERFFKEEPETASAEAASKGIGMTAPT